MMISKLKEILKKHPRTHAFLRSLRYHIQNNIQKKVSMLRLKVAVRKKPCRVILGAGGVIQNGWIGTNIETLNIVKVEDWQRLFKPCSIDAILAEHVWEHLTEDQAEQAATLCYRHLKQGGYCRIAVPDGFRPDSDYIEAVRPGGKLKGTHAHKQLFTYKTLSRLFEASGFEVVLKEYFDENGVFHYQNWDPKEGMIHRSKRFDWRNANGEMKYSSIVLDTFRR
jgi:predicted SAM-dependent methyltransferase